MQICFIITIYSSVLMKLVKRYIEDRFVKILKENIWSQKSLSCKKEIWTNRRMKALRLLELCFVINILKDIF